MCNFASMVHRHEDDVLNYFKMPIDNGTVEGLNNEAKLVIHKAYGFRTEKELHPQSLSLPCGHAATENHPYDCVRNRYVPRLPSAAE